MLLRRITEHVKAQNWTAVALDFVIVVVGVFIGIQVANWNDARADQQEFLLAKERLLDEAQANVSALDNIESEATVRIVDVRSAFEALQTCEDTAENIAAVNKGLAYIIGTIGISLQTTALKQITEEPMLASRLSPVERDLLDNLKFKLSVIQEEADYAEKLPLLERPANNPVIAIGDMEAVSGTYTGITFGGERRGLILATPVSVACTNNELLKSFLHWERWQERIPIYARVQREAIQHAMKDIE